MPFIGTGHIWLLGIVLVVVLIIWGPGKLPDVGSGMGRAIREFRKASTEAKEHVTAATSVSTAPVTATVHETPPPPPPPLLASASGRNGTGT